MDLAVVDRRPAAPSCLDAEVRELDRLSEGQVLLEELPLEQLRRALDRFDGALRDHLARDPADGPGPPGPADRRTTVLRLRAEHRHFAESLAQLWWFYRRVESNDHGGNRQALGQYGRLLAEAVRWHVQDEGGSTSGAATAPVPAAGLPPPRKR